MAKNSGIHASQAKNSRLYSGKVSVTSTPLIADRTRGLISLSVRYFKCSGLQYDRVRLLKLVLFWGVEDPFNYKLIARMNHSGNHIYFGNKKTINR